MSPFISTFSCLDVFWPTPILLRILLHFHLKICVHSQPFKLPGENPEAEKRWHSSSSSLAKSNKNKTKKEKKKKSELNKKENGKCWCRSWRPMWGQAISNICKSSKTRTRLLLNGGSLQSHALLSKAFFTASHHLRNPCKSLSFSLYGFGVYSAKIGIRNDHEKNIKFLDWSPMHARAWIPITLIWFWTKALMYHRNYSDSRIEFGDSDIKEVKMIVVIKILIK